MSADKGSSSAPGLGVVLATALVVGNMIGAGIFLLPGSMAELGGISLLGWLVSTAGAILLALVFVTFARAYPRDTGGPYAYVRRAFGPFLGFQTAWAYWVSVLAGQAAVTVSFLAYLAFFFPVVGDNTLVGVIAGIGVLWGLTALNLRGAQSGGIVQIVTTVLKIVPLILIGVVGLFSINSSHFTPFNESGDSAGGAIIAATTLTLFAFIGLEAASVAAGKVRDPQRTIPIATVVGVLITAVIYIIGTISVLGVVPREQLLTSTAPFADAGEAIFGSWAGGFVALGALISTFGALNGWTLLQAEVPLAAANDGLFPRSFARVNSKGVPTFGMIMSTAGATLILLMSFSDNLVDQFTQILLMATLATLVPYAYAAAAQFVLLVTDRSAFNPRTLMRSIVIAGLAFAYSIFAMIGSGDEVIAKGFLLLLVAFPVYVFIVRPQTKSDDDSSPRAPDAPTTSAPVEGEMA
jgi:APA family basic amino acid/polyamine antiporter